MLVDFLAPGWPLTDDAHSPKHNADLVRANKESALRSWCNLTQIQWHRSRHNTRANTSNDAPDNHHGQMDRGRLENRAQAENRNTDEASPATSEAVVGRASEEGEAKKLAGIEDGGDEARVT
jgi:hypothetical protein